MIWVKHGCTGRFRCENGQLVHCGHGRGNGGNYAGHFLNCTCPIAPPSPPPSPLQPPKPASIPPPLQQSAGPESAENLAACHGFCDNQRSAHHKLCKCHACDFHTHKLPAGTPCPGHEHRDPDTEAQASVHLVSEAINAALMHDGLRA